MTINKSYFTVVVIVWFYLACTEGYYKSLLNSTCVPCPMNSNSDKDGADHCECIDGYYRAPNEGVGKICTGKFLHCMC